jgi:uncharacterized membrane protein
MHKILISVFDDQTAAFEGVTALKELHGNGDITLYASTVVAKNENGTLAALQSSDSGPVGTLVGLVGGGLIGLLGGPVGAAAGAYVGGFGGAMVDLLHAGLSSDFVNEVAEEVTPGKVFLVADVDETWVTPIDTRLEALGGRTFRRYPGDIVDDDLARETEAASRELEELNDEFRASSGEAKAKLEAAIAEQRAKVDALVARVDKALADRKAEFEARLKTLRAQQDQAREEQRQRIRTRMDDLKASYEARKEKLEAARRLAKASAEKTREALVP